MIIDAHVHLRPGLGPVKEQAEELARFADVFQIEKMCLSLGRSRERTPTPEEFRAANDSVMEVARHMPDRYVGFCYLNPTYHDESQREIDRCIVEGGMGGIKLWIAIPCSNPCVFPIVERAIELSVPIVQHTWLKATGNYPYESTPYDFAELAARYPEAKLMMGHTGGDWELGIKLIRHLPNTYADICGGNPAAGIVEMCVRELGAERVLYGSDAPGRSFASQIAKVYGAAITDTERALVLGQNMERLLAP